LIAVALVLVALTVVVSVARGNRVLTVLEFALVVTIASVPVALPAVLSVTLAVGAMNLARRQAIVSRLTAIEELAGVDVFCSDKTGTLTQNKMEVSQPVLLDGATEQDLFVVAALASREENRDPIEQPIFQYLVEKLPQTDWRSYRQKNFIPFDPVRKRTEALIEDGDESFLAVKGAPQVLMGMAELPDAAAEALVGKVDQLAAAGYRTLAVGRKSGDAPLQLLGLIPLYDPPREDSGAVLSEMRANGVQVKMVTGDHIAIAREIGRLLGLDTNAIHSRQLTGGGSQELMGLASALAAAVYARLKGGASRVEAQRFAGEVMDTVRTLYDTSLLDMEFIHTHESAIIQMIERVDIFAEVVPEDKYRIVDTLQKGGHIVGMTGDGVNDAPALKKADCGIAVSGATNAARAAAAIVLTAPGLGVINEAIRQARITFERMKSYATFRIAETIRIILFMTLSIVVFNFYPITALMIILLALLNDIPILAIAYDHTRVDRKPVRWRMNELLTVATVLGMVGVVSSFLLYFILREQGLPNDLIQSIFFLKLIVAGHSTLYITRSEAWFWQRPWPSPPLFWATFGTEIVGTLIAVYGVFIPPIGWKYALLVWGYALAWFMVNNVARVWVCRLIPKTA
jgi:H+-transporting ATPase